MLALAFSFLAFVFWAVVGRAVVALVYPRFGALRSWLVAPAVGVSVLLLGLMVLNQAGSPIARCAAPLTAILGIFGVVVLFRCKPITPMRKLLPFYGAIVFAWIWAGWPALETGFNWISYANDDMANYCLAAERFMDHGFYAVPTMAELAGRDYSSYYFFMHVADMMRFGAEHLVAWGASLAHVKATQGFMPMILALALVQITGIGALVLQVGRNRRWALVTVWLLAVSPLFMLGTLYQLIAQVGGVALLLSTLALLLRPWGTARRPVLIRYAVLPAITAAALCIFYPEVTPFAGLTFAAVVAVWIVRNRTYPDALIGIAAYTMLGAVILLRHNVISYVSILVVQFNGAMQSSNMLLSLFPYFMLPTGFSNLFGWMPIAHDFGEPVVSGSIAVGMILMAATLARALRDSWRMAPAAILLLIQFVFAARLFAGANDFGLYKLAMWMQPVLMAGVAGWLLWWSGRRRGIMIASVVVYTLAAAPTALYYTNASRGHEAGGLTELRLASELGLHANAPADRNAQLTSTIENVVAAKFAASELRGYPLALVSRDFFAPTTRTDFVHPTWPVRLQPHYPEMAQALPLIKERYRKLVTTGSLWKTNFSQAIVDRPTDYYVSLDPELSLFNKFDLGSRPEHRDGVFVVEPASAVHNRLLFVHSALGNHYYLGDRRRISFFQQEDDLFAPGHTFNGIGRFMLLRIENPAPEVYLRIAATRTLVTGRTAWNPKAVIHSAGPDVPLGAVGNGAFNLFIGPLKPQLFEGASYLAVDFAELPRQLLDYRTGLKRLYNRRVLLDYRQLLGWARDVSAISPDEYAHLSRPRTVAAFPADLALAHGLEFAGAYEDGWLSPHARFVLAGAHAGQLVRIRGFVPQLTGSRLGTGTMRISVDDAEAINLPANIGTFDWLIPVPRTAAATSIDVQFSAVGALSGRDGRPAGAKLEYLGVDSASSVLECDYDSSHEPRIAATGIDQDGWAEKKSAFYLPPSESPSVLAIKIEYPGWSNAAPGEVCARVSDASISTRVSVQPGVTPTLRLVLPASAHLRTVTLDSPPEFQLPAPDCRLRSLRIVSIKLTPAPTT